MIFTERSLRWRDVTICRIQTVAQAPPEARANACGKTNTLTDIEI